MAGPGFFRASTTVRPVLARNVGAEAVEKFAASWHEMLASIEAQLAVESEK